MKTHHNRPPRTDEEQAYRRGAHQCCARLRDLASRRETLPEALDLLGRAEGVLAEFREGRADPGDRLLDELESRLAQTEEPPE